MSASLVFDARGESDTDRLGAALADALPGTAVVAMFGTLGSGKTRLVRAIAGAAGVTEKTVTSPTFVLIHEYRGRRAIFHMDAYRVKDEDEFLALGPEEYFDADGITFVEWADRVDKLIPPERLEIHIDPTGETSRRFTIVGKGDRYESTVEKLRSAFDGQTPMP